MFKRVVFLSSALILGSFSFAHASVSSVVEACSGSACAAAIEAEIAGLAPAQVDGFLADLAEAVSSAVVPAAVKNAVAASLSALSANPSYAAYSVSMASLSTGLTTSQTATAAVEAAAAPESGSGN